MRRIRGAGHGPLVLAALVVISAPASAAVAPKTVPVQRWSTSVCTDFSRWERQLTRLGSTGVLASPTAGKAAITKFLTGAINATDGLAKDLRTAGVPRVKNGKAIAAAFISSVTSLRGAYAKAKTTAKGLPTGDQAEFATAAQSIVTQLQTAGTTLDTTLTTTAQRYPASALDKAFSSTKACTTLIPPTRSRGAAPPVTTTTLPAGPPCTAAAIGQAIQSHGETVSSVDDFKCGNGWAGANYTTHQTSVATLLKAAGNNWQVVNRAQYCNDPSIPTDVHFYCTIS